MLVSVPVTVLCLGLAVVMMLASFQADATYALLLVEYSYISTKLMCLIQTPWDENLT